MNSKILKEIDGENPLVTQEQLTFLNDVISVINERTLNEVDLQKEKENNFQIIKGLANITKQLEVIISRLKSGPKAKREFNEIYPIWKKGREDAINQFKEIAKSLQEDRFNCNVAKLVGYSTSFVGGTLCLASAALIPFTFGLSSPLAVTGGTMLAAGSTTALGTSVTETIRLKAQIDEAQKILNEDKERFQEMCGWIEQAIDLEKALAEILNIDIVKSIYESVKELVKRGMDIKDHRARFNYIDEKLKSIMEYMPEEWKKVPSYAIVAIIFPLVTLFVLLCKIENRLVFDCATLTLKSFVSALQLADDAFDLVKLSSLFNINAVMGKTLLHSAVAALGIAIDVAGIALTSIDVYNGSCSPEADKILKASEEMEKQADKMKNIYENISK